MNPLASSVKETIGLIQSVIVCGLVVGIPLIIAVLLLRERLAAKVSPWGRR